MHSSMERTRIQNIRLHVLPTDRFKTYAITVLIGSRLEESTVTPTALIPFVLRRGNAVYPETKQFREKLDSLYGAGFGFDVVKRGDYQIVQFRFDMIESRYVLEDRSLLRDALEFVGTTLTKPLVEDGGFRTAYTEAEKNTLQRRIESLINDKIRYASERCLEEMCENEPYRLHPLGKIDEISKWNAVSLYEYYREWLENAAMDLYIVGNTTLEEVVPWVKESFRLNGESGEREDNVYVRQKPRPARPEIKTVTESLEVSQGKLNMGLRMPVTYADSDYPAAIVYNGILGGYPHSKLFMNVREKASMAYYAASRLDGHKGIVTIQSGIEVSHYERAVQLIRDQLQDLENGRISDLEMRQTKAMIANQLRETLDSAFDMTAFDFNNVLAGSDRTISELIRDIGKVEKDDVRRIAEKVRLDTIYFLKDRKGGSEHADNQV